jgi:hypothetical protein
MMEGHIVYDHNFDGQTKFSNRIIDLDDLGSKASNDEAACISTSRLSNDVLSRFGGSGVSLPPTQKASALRYALMPYWQGCFSVLPNFRT